MNLKNENGTVLPKILGNIHLNPVTCFSNLDLTFKNKINQTNGILMLWKAYLEFQQRRFLGFWRLAKIVRMENIYNR